MELIFDFDQHQGLANVRFEGLDGTEGVTSMKQALSLLKIRHPAVTFREAVERMQYFNAAGCSSSTTAMFRNVKSGWTFTAKGIIQYIDGTIEWDHSSDGHFANMDEDE